MLVQGFPNRVFPFLQSNVASLQMKLPLTVIPCPENPGSREPVNLSVPAMFVPVKRGVSLNWQCSMLKSEGILAEVISSVSVIHAP